MVPGIIVPVRLEDFSYSQEEGLPQLLFKKVVAIGTFNNPKPFAIGYSCVNDFASQMASGVIYLLNS